MHWQVIAPLSKEGGRTLLARREGVLKVLRALEQDPFWTQPSPTNVVPMREVIELEGRAWGVYDVVRGVSLRAFLTHLAEASVKPPASVVARVIVDAAWALTRVFPKRLHGGLSDRSILVGFDGQTHVMDFGAPRANRFQPPQNSPARDVFALAAVLHSELTGFQGNYAEPLTGKAPLKFPSQLDASSPQALDDVLQRALARSEEARQVDVGALAQDIERAFADALATRGNVAAMLGLALRERRAELDILLNDTPAIDALFSPAEPKEEHTDPDLNTLRAKAAASPGGLSATGGPPVLHAVDPSSAEPIVTTGVLLDEEEKTAAIEAPVDEPPPVEQVPWSTEPQTDAPMALPPSPPPRASAPRDALASLPSAAGFDEDESESTQVLDLRRTRELLKASTRPELPVVDSADFEDSPTQVLDGAKALALARASASRSGAVSSAPPPPPAIPPAMSPPAIAPVSAHLQIPPPPPMSPQPPSVAPHHSPPPPPQHSPPPPPPQHSPPPAPRQSPASPPQHSPPRPPPRPEEAAVVAPPPLPPSRTAEMPPPEVPAPAAPASSPSSEIKLLDVPRPKTSELPRRTTLGGADDLVAVSAEHMVPLYGLKLTKDDEPAEPRAPAAAPPPVETKKAELPKPPPPTRGRIILAVVLVGLAFLVGYLAPNRGGDAARPTNPSKPAQEVDAAVDEPVVEFDEPDATADDALLPARLREDAGTRRRREGGTPSKRR